MSKKSVVAILGAVVFQLVLTESRVDASDQSRDIEGPLVKKGYALSESGMREVLSKSDHFVARECLLYIEQEQLVNLVPEVKAYSEHIETLDYFNEESRLWAVQCLLAIDKEMTKDSLAAYMERIRRQLYNQEFEGVPIEAYCALLTAQKYWSVDIYDDLLFLSCTNRMREREFPFTTKTLFELYGDEVPEADLNTMLEPWRDFPERQEFILRRAREHGIRLEAVDRKGVQRGTAESETKLEN